MESSKSTTRHIKQVASDPKQVQWTWWDIKEQTSHQAIASGNNVLTSPDQRVRRGTQVKLKNQGPPYKKRFDLNKAHQRRDKCWNCCDSKHREGFMCPARKYQCRNCNRYGHFTSLCYRRSECSKSRTPRHISCKLDWYICEKISYMASQKISPLVMNLSIYKYRYNVHKQIPSFPHHIILLPMFNIDWSTPHEKSVPETQIGYMFQCKHNACQHLQVSVPGPWL